MDSKLFLNTIKVLNPTYLDLVSRLSKGDTMMSHLQTFERILSVCLRDNIIELNPLWMDTEAKLRTHSRFTPNDILSYDEFKAWAITYEQIMRDEGLVGNTGTGEDEADRESVFIDPFLTPFVRKRGTSVSKVDEADGGDGEGSEEEDRTDEEPWDGEDASGGADILSDPETGEFEDEESDEEYEDDEESDEGDEDGFDEKSEDESDEFITEEEIDPDAENDEGVPGFHSFAFSMNPDEVVQEGSDDEESDEDEFDEGEEPEPEESHERKVCPVCGNLFDSGIGHTLYSTDGREMCSSCTYEYEHAGEGEEPEPEDKKDEDDIFFFRIDGDKLVPVVDYPEPIVPTFKEIITANKFGVRTKGDER